MRAHATTCERPSARLAIEREVLLALPTLACVPPTVSSPPRRVMPRESQQDPLAVYDALLELVT